MELNDNSKSKNEFSDLKVAVTDLFSKLNMMDLPSSYFETIMKSIQEIVIRICAVVEDASKLDLAVFKQTIIQIQLLFENTSTFKNVKKIKSQPTFVKAQASVIGVQTKQVLYPSLPSSGYSELVHISKPIPDCLYIISIADTIRMMFKNAEFLNWYKSYTPHSCDPNLFKNVCCGNIYKSSTFFQSHLKPLMLQLYYDDFETCNPLKSKTGKYKIGALYISLKNLPGNLQSKLEHIHVAALFLVENLKKHNKDLNYVLEIIVNELNLIGLTGVYIEELEQNVHAGLVNVAGDNLGMYLA